MATSRCLKNLLVAAFLFAWSGGACWGINRSWDAGGADDDWSTPNNWSPNGNPDDDDLTIGNLLQGFGAQTSVDQDIAIASLSLQNAASVDTDGFGLVVNGAVQLSDVDSRLQLRNRITRGDTNHSLDTDSLFIGTGSIVEMYDGAVLEVDDGDLTNFGTLVGNGTIELNDTPALPEALFVNSGTLNVGRPGLSLGTLPPLTLQITANQGNARVDLDGNGNGQVLVQSNATLDLDVPLFEDFSGTLGLGPNATLDIESSWGLDGELHADTSSFLQTEQAVVRGGNLVVQPGGSIVLDETDEALRFESSVTALGGTVLDNSGTVTFDAPASFASAADFQMNSNFASMVVNSQVSINQNAFNFDGGGTTNNQVTVNPGGQLVVDVGGIDADNKVDNVITINSGELQLNVDAVSWTMDGTLRMNNTSGTAAVVGPVDPTTQTIIIGDNNGASDANLEVGGNGLSVFTYRGVQFGNDADVDIAEGAILDLESLGIYAGQDATFDGAGTLRPGLMRINAATTFNVAIVDLEDEVFPTVATSHEINRPLTINADSIDEAGDGFDGNIDINPVGSLTVVVPGSWRFDAGEIRLDAGACLGCIQLAGSPIELGVEGGTLTIVGGGPRSEAHLTVLGNIEFENAGTEFRMSGGSSANPNRIEGGTIQGPGTLIVDNTELHGFGTITSTVDSMGAGFGAIVADDGTLSLGEVDLLRVLGVTDDGVLELTEVLETTSAFDGVILQGGEITGEDIIHNNPGGLIVGHGTISSRIDNRQLIASQNGTLILQATGGPNLWSGLTDTGELHAQSGDMILRSHSEGNNESFNGQMSINPGQEIFVENFFPPTHFRFDADHCRSNLPRGHCVSARRPNHHQRPGPFAVGQRHASRRLPRQQHHHAQRRPGT